MKHPPNTAILNPSNSSPRRRFLKRVLWFAALHYIVVLALAGIIFLAIHLPPKAIHLDPVIEGLVAIENILLAPRKALLWLWPWEATPTGLGLVASLLNSLSWGVLLANGSAFWKKVTR